MNNKVRFIEQYKKIVQELIQNRKMIPMTQNEIADMLNVDRRKIIALENGGINISLLLDYCDKMSIEINLNFEVC